MFTLSSSRVFRGTSPIYRIVSCDARLDILEISTAAWIIRIQQFLRQMMVLRQAMQEHDAEYPIQAKRVDRMEELIRPLL